ncbi:MAG TPA: hydroxymethylbilane synthase, partial [Thermomicrobiales bacterium]|nr:hydroxymethylbilane synthase [Thermomicrobiales bacterium]
SAVPRPIRLGTRGSALARAQCDLVRKLIRDQHPGIGVETVLIRTEGDADKHSPLTVIGGRGVFTSALQDALRLRRIDAAVHSAKDLPSQDAPGLRFAAFLAREDPRDVLVSRHGCSLAELPPAPLIGTSSRRRATQIRHARPDARVTELRGNVDTRLRKAHSGPLDGIVLAAAGVTRMGWDPQISEYLPLDHFVPAPGQGALALEVRDDAARDSLFDALADPAYSLPVRVERAFLRGIGAGCTTPIGAYATLEEGRVLLRCMLASDDGIRAEWRTASFNSDEAEVGAADLARELLSAVSGPTSIGTPRSADHRPLSGKVVVVTRPAADAGDLCRLIEDAGGEALRAPAIRVESTPFDADMVSEGLRGGRWDWIAFTSRNAVRGFVDGLGKDVSDPAVLGPVRIAAVGPGTADAISEHGLRVDLVSLGTNARDLGSNLAATGVVGCRVLLPQGNLSRPELSNTLSEHGARVDAIDVYRTVPECSLPEALHDRLRRREIDAVTFTSPSSVREFVRLLADDAVWMAGTVVACIGETTATEAQSYGLGPVVIAERPGAGELVAAVIPALERAPKSSIKGVRA